jgi:hypothetical protein
MTKRKKQHKKKNQLVPGMKHKFLGHTGLQKDPRYPSQWIQHYEAPFPTLGCFDNQIYNLVDSVENLGAFTTSATLNTFYGLFFALSSLGDASTYQACFDQYRIMGAKVQVSPTFDLPLGTYTGHIHTCIDYDDVNSITPATMMTYANVMVSNPGDTLIRSLKPHAAIGMYSGAFTSFGNVTSPWIDTASSTVQHYGFKLAANPTNVALLYDVVTSIWLQFRNTR